MGNGKDGKRNPHPWFVGRHVTLINKIWAVESCEVNTMKGYGYAIAMKPHANTFNAQNAIYPCHHVPLAFKPISTKWEGAPCGGDHSPIMAEVFCDFHTESPLFGSDGAAVNIVIAFITAPARN